MEKSSDLTSTMMARTARDAQMYFSAYNKSFHRNQSSLPAKVDQLMNERARSIQFLMPRSFNFLLSFHSCDCCF